MSSPPTHKHPNPAADLSVTASLVLLSAALLALIAANSPWAAQFKAFWATDVAIGVGPFAISDDLKSWVKNALMAVFFLHVGLEIKAEFMEGTLADPKRVLLPIVAAVGGIVVPAAIYLAIVGSDPALARGWAIPAATDIAFAVGVVGLLGKRVPLALKTFLLAVAVIDDLAAITIVAVFYSGDLAFVPMMLAVAVLVGMKALNKMRIASLWPYLALGVLLWVAVYHAGLSPTLAGVATAGFVLMSHPHEDGESPLHRLESALRYTVLFAIMPLFALANAGVAIWGNGGALGSPLVVAIAAALIVGKPVGIVLAVYGATRLGVATLPEGASWRQVFGIGALAGIGFTMSLFIGYLAFGEGPQIDAVRIGVLSGSLVSALIGAALLWRR